MDNTKKTSRERGNIPGLSIVSGLIMILLFLALIYIFYKKVGGGSATITDQIKARLSTLLSGGE